MRPPTFGQPVSTHEMRNAYKVLVGNLGRSRCTLEDNIKMDLRETGWGRCRPDLSKSGQGQWWALVSTVMNLRVPYKTGNSLSS